MSSNQDHQAPSAPNDLPPPYSSVVGNQPQYGFVVPPQGEAYQPAAGYPLPQAKSYTAPGVYPHPPADATYTQPLGAGPAPPMTVPVGIVIPQVMGTEPTTVTCHHCANVVTTKVNYTPAWHTHLAAGSICIITMMCSLCCLGLVPYCFDTFKDAEHYCPNCNTFIGKSSRC